MSERKIIIYTRLSVKHRKEREMSLENQEAICRGYIREHGIQAGDTQGKILIFRDDGFSGCQFERPGFQKMMEMVYRGTVEWILVKDMSRLGRDYKKTGYYVEKLFPVHQVRFTAVGEQYDSICENKTMSIYAMQNLLNEWYAKDIGRKVSLIKDRQKQNGDYLGSCPPYGYQIIKKQKKRILKRDKSYIVIFAIMMLHGRGYTSEKISEWLMQNKIATPRFYRETGSLYGGGKETKWNSGTIRRIIQREISHSRGDYYTT